MRNETRRSLTTGRFMLGRGHRVTDRRVSRPAIRASASGGNSIAHCDNRTYRGYVEDGHAAPVDRTANGHGDTATGADTTADAYAGTALRQRERRGVVSAMVSDSYADGATDMDSLTDFRPVLDTGPDWSLSAVLLADCDARNGG